MPSAERPSLEQSMRVSHDLNFMNHQSLESKKVSFPLATEQMTKEENDAASPPLKKERIYKLNAGAYPASIARTSI